ncbi:hypothetical protein FKW77_002739 [Venturia effusa]|uniref:Cytidyltransferase-like domain-containing protein n=1 Tax=Venturia effusa TaxID=50376 RepID=A0A517LF24_9PEZI|nr:hypothetical protein FKW77_002739 [Venturia effusa]
MALLHTEADSIIPRGCNPSIEPLRTTSSSDCPDVFTSSKTSSPSSSKTEIPPPASSSLSDLPPNALEKYVTKAYNQHDNQSPRSFFRRSPVLHKNGVNRVLLYYGCFNPPHIAHLNVLRHIYTETSYEFNVVGAIVIPLCDKSCVSKFTNRNDSSHLYSIKERMKLWEQDPEFPDWACVVESDIARTDDFRFDLRVSAGQDGFDIKFVSVFGPDHVTSAKGIGYCIREVMFCDAGRATDLVTADGLLTLPDYTPWERVRLSKESRIPASRRREVHRDELQEHARGYISAGRDVCTGRGSQDFDRGYAAGQSYLEGLEASNLGLPAHPEKWKKCKDYAKGFSDGLKTPHNDDNDDDDENSDGTSKEASTTDAQTLPPKKFDPNAMYTCRHIRNTENVIFVPTTDDSIYRTYISSTEIRAMMSKNKANPKQMTPEMAGFVLGPHRKPQIVSSIKPQTRSQQISKGLYESSIFPGSLDDMSGGD